MTYLMNLRIMLKEFHQNLITSHPEKLSLKFIQIFRPSIKLLEKQMLLIGSWALLRKIN